MGIARTLIKWYNIKINSTENFYRVKQKRREQKNTAREEMIK